MNKNERSVGEMEARFGFGANWRHFLSSVDESRIALAEQSLREMLQRESLEGLRFLDVGSGSGLFSLAARNLGAVVYSFDYDPQSVDCTQEMRARYRRNDEGWIIEQGDALNQAYLAKLGTFDVVYSWGVLHHTGEMWRALENMVPLVNEGGQLFIALYNDQGRTSRTWHSVKKAYNTLPNGFRWVILWPAFLRLWGQTIIRDFFRFQPFVTWRNYGRKNSRGMSPWRDVVDWVGGFPFEVATPEDIFDFFRRRDFELQRLKTCGGGLGCNEFIFLKRFSKDQ
jgi:2-polyprenyl-6-hydroxyphenyl methylase/3-demethylubiquinone-9 3-methyltransferase